MNVFKLEKDNFNVSREDRVLEKPEAGRSFWRLRQEVMNGLKQWHMKQRICSEDKISRI